MTALWVLVSTSLRLNLRNRMAMIYGYIFPLVFLLAFATLYRHDPVPVLRHVGELLTVTLLGSACFGMPTGMVSEREKGVWRRYRITSASPAVFITSVLVTRYVLALSAASLQLVVAVCIGMPIPRHPVQLLAAFSVAAVAFLGIGLQIAMLADSVPAVQAVGQCVFLPMLIIGGVAVPLVSLPHWAQVLSAFLPGRYAVQAMQAAMQGEGLRGVAVDLLYLVLFGLAGAAASLFTFRWHPTALRSSGRQKGYLALALMVWIGIGLVALRRDRGRPVPDGEAVVAEAAPGVPATAEPVAQDGPSADAVVKPVAPKGVPEAKRWQDVTEAQIKTIAFERLPPDVGLVSPIAQPGETSDADSNDQLEVVRAQLATWAGGKVSDPVQRVRNDLYVAAVPDLLQIAPIERFIPLLVFSRIRADVPAEELPKVLYWIATHPEDGNDAALAQMPAFGLPVPEGRKRAVRGRVMIYAMKLLGRQMGAIGAAGAK